MSIYSYFCDERHETEWIGTYEARPRLTACHECGLDAWLGFATSKYQGVVTHVQLNKTYNEEVHGLTMHNFKCESCEKSFDEIIDGSDGVKASDGIPCPDCGDHARWIPSAKIDRASERFPYYDHGLGMIVKSRQHRKDICKNPRQYGINANELTPVEGDWDADSYANANRRRDEEDEKVYKEYEDKLDNAPEFGSFRKARDQGLV